MIFAFTLAFAVDLDATRQRVVDHAVEVARAEARAAEARGATWQAASGALPQVELFASGSRGAGLTSFGFERPVATQAGAGVRGSWQLLAPGSWAATDAARHSALGARALRDWARVTARRDATVAVAELWVAQDEAAAWSAAVDDATEALDAVQSLVDAGLRPPADAARARADRASLSARAASAEGEVAGRCARVRALLREPVAASCDAVVVGELLPAESSAQHPALVAAEEAVAAARGARTSALLDRGPTLEATGTAAHYLAGDASGFGWSAGLEAQLPLVSGGAGIGSNQSARARADDATLALEAQQRDLDAARVDTEARFVAAQTSLEAQHAALAAAEEALALVAARYEQGLDGLESWLSARRARDEARAGLAQARGAHLAALAELESVRGVW